MSARRLGSELGSATRQAREAASAPGGFTRSALRRSAVDACQTAPSTAGRIVSRVLFGCDALRGDARGLRHQAELGQEPNLVELHVRTLDLSRTYLEDRDDG